MDENKVRQIAREVYQSLGSRFGVNQTPTHTHNDIDSSKLSLSSITTAQILSAQTGGVLASNAALNLAQPVAVLPVPVLTSAPSGNAPDGTLVIAVVSSVPRLYVCISNTWQKIGPLLP